MSTIKHSELDSVLDQELYLVVKTVSLDPVYYVCEPTDTTLFKKKIIGSKLKFLIGPSIDEEMTLDELPYYIFEKSGIKIKCNCMFDCKCFRKIEIEIDGRMLRESDKGMVFF